MHSLSFLAILYHKNRFLPAPVSAVTPSWIKLVKLNIIFGISIRLIEIKFLDFEYGGLGGRYHLGGTERDPTKTL